LAKTSQAPLFVRVANVLTMTLARAGFKLVGHPKHNRMGNYPMYLLTVRGRKSGQPRTVPIVIIEPQAEREELRFFRARFQQ
jgi:hypothetical protein